MTKTRDPHRERFRAINLWTEREREVIALVHRGLTYQEVADELGISSTTVRTHVSRAARLLPGDHTPLRKILRMPDGPESTPKCGDTRKGFW